MGKAVGSTKSGGRAKGTPNKRTKALYELLEERGIDPIGEILNELPELSSELRIKTYLALLPYLYPKRKPTEQTQQSFNQQLEELSTKELERLKDQIAEKLGYNKPPEELTLEQIDSFILKLQEARQLKKNLNTLEKYGI